MSSLLIHNGKIVEADGERVADIFIENGIIKSLTSNISSLASIAPDQVLDAEGLLIFPGLIDCHVHFREPGLEHKATMATEAAAAIAGGVMTVCEMPNTVPPTVTVAALADKVRRAQSLCHGELVEPWRDGSKNEVSHALRRAQGDKYFDLRFFFGATELIHLAALRELFTSSSDELKRLRARCCGLKLYFDHSTGDQGADKEVIEEGFKICAELGITLVAHCEDAGTNRMESGKWKVENAIEAHSKMRPPEAEAIAIERTIGLVEKYGTKFHVAHLSTKQGIALVKAAKTKGLSVTCEVAPHHLFLTVDDYATLGTLGKMNPPLRTRDHQEALWQGIMDGTVDCIATDHAPHTLEEKLGVMGDQGVTLSGVEERHRPTQEGHPSPLQAPSGVPGVETMIPLLLSVASGHWPRPQNGKWKVENPDKKKSFTIFYLPFSIHHILRLCFTNPNHIFNLGKQGIVEGAPADIILVDPKAEWVVEGEKLHGKCGWTPYEGWQVRGRVC